MRFKPPRQMTDTIRAGWPDSKEQVTFGISDYCPFREVLVLQDGSIFKGDRVVIPFGMREEIERKLHASHLGQQ